MVDTTVVYYTANYEDEVFEGKIKQALLENMGDLPLISVSQKPIDLGMNICVGDIGRTGPNAWRQLKIGAIAAKTKYICTAESDFIYPPEYFQFKPYHDHLFFVADPVYVFFDQLGRERLFSIKSHGSEGAILVNRELLIRRIEEMYQGLGEWEQPTETIHMFGAGLPYKRLRFQLPSPVVTFKTNRNMTRRTLHDKENYLKEIPYWGSVNDIVRRFL